MRLHPNRASMFAIVSACCLFAATANAQQINVDKNNRTIAVTSTDSSSAMADMAQVNIGYQVYGPDSKTAYANASEVSNAVSKALADAGVAQNAIESDTQNIAETPPYELEKLSPAEQAQRRFRVQQSWTVKARAKDAAGILNLAIGAGANQGGQISWIVADESGLEAQAAGKALAHAHAVAEQMAKGLGIKLGDLIYASNQAPEPRPLMMGRAGGVMGGIMGGMAEQKAAPIPLSIQPHKVERSATVYAVFSIE